MRTVVAALTLFAALMFVSLSGPRISLAADCSFDLGFKTFHDLAPDVVGDCVTLAEPQPSGDVQQRTVNGLLVWRKSDNWTAFTNGSRTWVAGPCGLQDRRNAQRFAWEVDSRDPNCVVYAFLPGDAVAETLLGSGLPVTDVRVFDAETDPNHRLARPGEYVAKVSWFDSRATDVNDEATIELFYDAATLENRRAYIASSFEAFPMVRQYMFENTTAFALIRVPLKLTPDQAAEYERWLATL